MKTTIIELLNKLSKGEIPKKIKLDNDVYEYDEAQEDYYNDDIGIVNWLFDDYIIGVKQLDYEVEIIEETEEIDIDRAIIIEKDNSNREFIKFKNGATGSGYTCDYSEIDLIFAKAIKQINNKIKEYGGVEHE